MHQISLRVYYEDTDLAGIVYYANYLKFIERARSEWLRELGVDQSALKRDGLVFVVRRLEADYLSPAHFDDLVQVRTGVNALGSARITLCQNIIRDDRVLFSAVVTLVCIDAAGRPVRLSGAVRGALDAAANTGN